MDSYGKSRKEEGEVSMSLDSRLEREERMIERARAFAQKRPFDYQMIVLANDPASHMIGSTFLLSAYAFSDYATEEARLIIGLGISTMEQSQERSDAMLFLGIGYLATRLAILCGRGIYSYIQQRNIERSEIQL